MSSSKDRQRRQARKHLEEQRRRRAEAAARARRRRAIIGVVLAVLLVAGGGGIAILTAGGEPTDAASNSGPTPGATPEPTAQPSAKAGECLYTADKAGGGKDVGLPPVDPGKAVKSARTATLRTNKGDISIRLDAKAPCAVNSIAFLAKKDFYDKSVCHRLGTADNGSPPMLQCGNPSAKGDGSPTDSMGGVSYRFAEENLEGAAPYKRGTVAMAKTAEPNSTGSQFFLVYDETGLDGPKYTPVGKITKGMDVLDKIAKAGVLGEGTGSAPKEKVVIEDVKIAK